MKHIFYLTFYLYEYIDKRSETNITNKLIFLLEREITN